MKSQEDIYQELILASEADLAGNATDAEIALLQSFPAIHLAILKTKKKEVEFQFANHKALIQEADLKLYKDKITEEQYKQTIAEAMRWRAKAVSFLARIESRIIKLKVVLNQWPLNGNETNS